MTDSIESDASGVVGTGEGDREHAVADEEDMGVTWRTGRNEEIRGQRTRRRYMEAEDATEDRVGREKEIGRSCRCRRVGHTAWPLAAGASCRLR